MLQLTTKKHAQDLLDQIDTFLFDCDGVIWRGEQILPFVRETIQFLRQAGKRVAFVSNNSGKARKAYQEKFLKLGIPVNPEEIYGSADATVYYLNTLFPTKSEIYVVGQDGLKKAIQQAGFVCSGGSDDNQHLEWSDIAQLEDNKQVKAVVAGVDNHLSYTKLAKAHLYLNRSNCHFIATNDDSTLPLNGSLFPGSGVMVGAITISTKRTPTIIGKPHQPMLDYVLNSLPNLDVQRTCMVGDRLNTDVRFGKLGGMKTFLVLSGVTTEQEALQATSHDLPDYYAQELGCLYRLLLTAQES